MILVASRIIEKVCIRLFNYREYKLKTQRFQIFIVNSFFFINANKCFWYLKILLSVIDGFSNIGFLRRIGLNDVFLKKVLKTENPLV